MNKKSGSKRRRPDETHTAATTSSGESNQENIQAKQQRLEEYKFNPNVVLSLVEVDQAEFLRDSLKLVEHFINNESLRLTITRLFRVESNSFAENLLKVKVKFSDWSRAKIKPPDKSIVALVWIDKRKTDKININKKFWERSTVTNDEAEKKRIQFMIALCILHACGHLAHQWTTDDERFECKVVNGKRVVLAECQGEAGRVFENILFGSELVVILKTENTLNWNKNVEITAVAVESDRKNNKFAIINQDFISKSLGSLIKQDEICNLKTIKIIKLPPAHSVLKCSHQQDAMGRLVTKGMMVNRLCGTLSNNHSRPPG